ncbi:uncharacterized protein BDW43DRAFT_277375 [Aspergillus alliaceus]|uniref:uncharacterized protein n=1 Tax=Petromyces alliaceus TaxID=209559 RepID=UPI0012A7148C|nr:uncharacterized protein BDW43DRAFT_277375 [Aspergillus alliaceus]KAB8233103.1 hypothetical protein BDW43DRAFT_277375 [Aspergillus alliaceus]
MLHDLPDITADQLTAPVDPTISSHCGICLIRPGVGVGKTAPRGSFSLAFLVILLRFSLSSGAHYLLLLL